MASKNISITDDVYHELSKIKKNGESFSEVIHRLIDESKKDPMKLFGALKEIPKEDWKIYEKGLEDLKSGNQKESKKKLIENRW